MGVLAPPISLRAKRGNPALVKLDSGVRRNDVIVMKEVPR